MLSIGQRASLVEGDSGLLISKDDVARHGDNVARDTNVTVDDELTRLVNGLGKACSVDYGLESSFNQVLTPWVSWGLEGLVRFSWISHASFYFFSSAGFL